MKAQHFKVFLLLVVLLSGGSLAYAQRIANFLWAKELVLTDSTTSYVKQHRLTTDSAGNIYEVFVFSNRQVFGTDTLYAPLQNSVIVKLGADGNQKWVLPMGARLAHDVMGLHVRKDGSLTVMTHTTSRGWIGGLSLPDTCETDVLMHLDSSGRVLDVRQFNRDPANNLSFSSNMIEDYEGNTWVTCVILENDSAQVGDTTYYSPPNRRTGYIMRLDPQGRLVTSKQFDVPVGVFSSDRDGNVYLAGITFRHRTVNIPGLGPVPENREFILKLSPQGNAIWYCTIGTSTLAVYEFDAVALDNNQNSYVAGRYMDTLRINEQIVLTRRTAIIDRGTGYLAKIDKNGHLVWVHNLGVISGSTNNVPVDVRQLLYSKGVISFCGMVNGEAELGQTHFNPSSPYTDSYVAQADTNGSVLWADDIIGTGANRIAYAHFLGQDGAGNLLVAGDKVGRTLYGSAGLPTYNRQGLFLAKIGHINLPTSTRIPEGRDFNLYPSPSRGIVHLSHSNGGVVRVYNTLGVMVTESYSTRVDLTGQRPGLYWIEQELNGQRVRKRVVLE